MKLVNRLEHSPESKERFLREPIARHSSSPILHSTSGVDPTASRSPRRETLHIITASTTHCDAYHRISRGPLSTYSERNGWNLLIVNNSRVT